MGHYIYLEERRIAYARAHGCFLRKRGEIFAPEWMGWEERGRSLEEDFKRLAAHHGLSGKNIILVLGVDLSFLGLSLPKAAGSVVERMAVNQLFVKEGVPQDPAAAVTIGYSKTRDKAFAALFYVEGRLLTEYKNALRAAGMGCSHVLAAPDCMALAAQEMWKESSHLVVDVEEEQLGLYLVSGGNCLASDIASLRAGRFFQMKGEEMFYQEVAERAEHLFLMAGEREGCGSEGFRPECVVLLGDCLPDPEVGGERLAQLLALPCRMERLGEVPGGLIAACISGCLWGRTGKRRPARVKGNDKKGVIPFVQGSIGRVWRWWILCLLMNGAAALSVGLWFNLKEREEAAKAAEIRRAVTESERSQSFGGARAMKEEMERMAAMEAAGNLVMEEAAAGEKLLSMDSLQVLMDCLEPDMKVESITFEGEKGELSLVLSMDERGQIPLYVEGVREKGVFPHVNHSLWEQKEEEGMPERFFAAVTVSLKEGSQDEDD